MQKRRIDPLFGDIRNLPTREDQPVPPKRRTLRPVVSVVRLQHPFPNLRSHHLKTALRSFLAHPAKLPPDPASGPCVTTARLPRDAMAKADYLANERSRASLLRRLVYWHYYPSIWKARQQSAVPAKALAPVKAPVSDVPREVDHTVPLPQASASGKRELDALEFEALVRTYGYSVKAQSGSRYFLLPNGHIEQVEGEKALRIWDK